MEIPILTSKIPKLDLHNEEAGIVHALVTDFLKKEHLSNEKIVRIIHGKSTDINTKEVHKTLKSSKLVLAYKRNPWNIGETIVKLKNK